ncbi:hypothetical protein A2U01_0009831 [Trifolium medium]|uniref:Uncharacterized protein n=1 Tax=Trifolium medium TaxID=97028 RepID=A0A392MQJ2_9FABA|nr:hypothetical protein [Trifolium medium]
MTEMVSIPLRRNDTTQKWSGAASLVCSLRGVRNFYLEAVLGSVLQWNSGILYSAGWV